MFCGDGINDIAALSAADVGLAVGATDAVIAATLSTSRGSVAGKSQFLPFHNPGRPLAMHMHIYRFCHPLRFHNSVLQVKHTLQWHEKSSITAEISM